MTSLFEPSTQCGREANATSLSILLPSYRFRSSPRSSESRTVTERISPNSVTRSSALTTANTADRPNRAQDAIAEMFAYAHHLGEAKRGVLDTHRQRDDVVSSLLRAEVDGDSLSDLEFDLFFMLLTVAGNETTRTAIAQGVAAFFDHPDQWRRLRGRPIAPSVRSRGNTSLHHPAASLPPHRNKEYNRLRRTHPNGRQSRPVVRIGELR